MILHNIVKPHYEPRCPKYKQLNLKLYQTPAASSNHCRFTPSNSIKLLLQVVIIVDLHPQILYYNHINMIL